jgi:hypothetical protein
LGTALKLYKSHQVDMTERKRKQPRRKEIKEDMTITNSIPSLISADRPTIVVPPALEGPFQGWGTRIG